MRARALWPFVFLALAGCAKDRRAWPPGDYGDPAARAREAEAELRRFGEGRFVVDEFHAISESRLTFLDDYDFPTRVLAVNFEAKVRAARDVAVSSTEDIMHRAAEPDFSLADFERDAQLRRLLGDGLRAGEPRSIRASAAFDLIEPELRFRLFDRERGPQ